MMAKIMFATMTVVFLLSTLNSFGAAMTCNNIEDQGVCSKDCRRKGFGYGKCDFGDCSCYGSRRPTDRSDEDDSKERVDEDLEESLIDRHFVQRRPVAPTSADGKRRLCTSELTQMDLVPSHHRCRKFCSWLHSKVDISMDNICCCMNSN